jgi:gamma-glutamylcyclotransferase (GGCT)/AIG2-like uncharacterized protein YtfP
MSTDPYLGDKVFVYGTLRRGFINNEATLAFRNGATFLCDGTLPGALYSVGWYPALVEGAPGKAHGEVWELSTPGLMDVLDDYEGLFDDGPPEYKRERRRISTRSGPVEAWAYIYLHDVDPRQIIRSGDWAETFNAPQDG